MIVAVDRINNPKSPYNGKWCVYTSQALYQPIEMVYISKSKKQCVAYAKRISSAKPIITNGIDYGARF
jgi:hypothetical protein